MKKWTGIFTAIILLLLGCKLGSPASTAPPIPASSTSIPLQSDNPQSSNESQPNTPPKDQEAIKSEWRPLINGAAVLFSSCETMFDTYLNYQIEEIDLAGARLQLNTASGSISVVHDTFTKLPAPSPIILPFKERLEANMGTLLVLLSQQEAADIGSFEATDTLLETCNSLFDAQDEIAAAALSAGLSEASLAQLESETAQP